MAGASLGTSPALAYNVTPDTPDNVVHFRLDDRMGAITDGVTIDVEPIRSPEWISVDDVTVTLGRLVDVAVSFDVGEVSVGEKGHLTVALRGMTSDGQPTFVHEHTITLDVRVITDSVQQSYGIDECCTEIFAVDDPSGPPSVHQLVGATPNPFRSLTNIVFGLPVEGGVVELSIFDLQGRLVRSFETPRLGGGFHRIAWDGRDETGREVAVGMYFYRVTSGSWTQTQKLQLLP